MLTLMDVNCDKMIDRPVYSDNVRESMQQSGPLNTLLCDVIVCPKTCLLFYYSLKSVYFFFTKRVHTLRA